MKNKYYFQSILTIALLIASGFSSIYAQWPQWRGVNRDGICTEENLLKEWTATGPKRLWAVNFVGDGFASATVNENVIYTVGKIDSLEYVTAMDTKGNMLWQKAFGRAHKGEWPESRCTPTFYKNKLYVYSGFGDLACLDSNSGKIEWKLNNTERFGAIGAPVYAYCESPLVVNDKVFITTGGGITTLAALNYLNGSTIWKSESLNDTCDYVSPVILEITDKKLVFAGTRKYYFAADINTGKIVFKTNSLAGIVPTVVNKTKVYCNDGSKGTLLSYNSEKNDFTFAWCDSVPGSYEGGAVVIGDRLYSTNNNPTIGLFCVDLKSGKKLFSNKAIRESSLIATKDRIYAYDKTNGKVFLLKTTDSNVEIVGAFRVTIGTGPYLAHMSIANGILYIRHGKALMAYDISKNE